MSAVPNPALAAFLSAIGTEMVFCQVIIRRAAPSFALRHADDRLIPDDQLRLVSGPDLRAVAQFTAEGAFRPLKSAPNLARGWRSEPRHENDLWLALNILYPGAVADWFAAQATPPPITSYRDFTARQTGMYRITATLEDGAAVAAATACCHPESCLKRRLWTIAYLAPDAPETKSVIPCLEPCAVMLEFARKVARLEQGVVSSESAPAETAPGPVAECDFDAPSNPRRLRYARLRAGRA
ncbi:MAG TPA: DR2241 family protein [Verrucomicrobiae bacterium]|jgi:hypothetical protein|nr:DR2241 family protein [Verrucomicrobiae bacterium]